jgi:hypothetical protein
MSICTFYWRTLTGCLITAIIIFFSAFATSAPIQCATTRDCAQAAVDAANQAQDAVNALAAKINDPANLQITSTVLNGGGAEGYFDSPQSERAITALDAHRFCAITATRISSGTCDLHPSGNNWVISISGTAHCKVTCFDAKFQMQ